MTTNMITVSLAPQSNPRKTAKTLAGCPPHCSQSCKWTLSDEDGQFSISQFPKACVFFKYTGIVPKAFICVSKTNYDEQMMDQFPVLGHQMTHSIDSFITDSANSATALYTGHKSQLMHSVSTLTLANPPSMTPKLRPLLNCLAYYWRSRRDSLYCFYRRCNPCCTDSSYPRSQPVWCRRRFFPERYH